MWRILIVLSIALLFTQRVAAHEHDVQVVHRVATAEHVQGVHCDALHCEHSHASCCTTMCGAHCGALFVAYRFEPWTPDASQPPLAAGSRRASISYAPLLRPPIA
ncbi:hypothetical protein [Paraburkholderia sp.]|uniref:hypothetical protein n=1 Tax=Paraburkholderia sp. TaxID=1926495 RepID=UPI003D6FD504